MIHVPNTGCIGNGLESSERSLAGVADMDGGQSGGPFGLCNERAWAGSGSGRQIPNEADTTTP